MPLKPFHIIPESLRDWAEWCRNTTVTPGAETVTESMIADNAVSNRVLRDSAPNSVIGNPTGSSANPSDISAGADNTVLTRRSGALQFLALVDADIPATIARDIEVTAAIAAHEADPDPHPGLPPYYAQTAEELLAAVTPADLLYEPGDLRRYGAVGGDSSADSTAFTNALATGHPLRLPNLSSPYEITGPVLVPSNTVIWCDPGVEVMMPDGGLVSDIGWIRFRDVENVTLYGNNSRWYFQTKPVADEQRHVFDIRGASNITLRDVLAADCGGDGFYVGAGATNDYSENVYLENIRADNCRRQGLSIVSAINCWVNGAYFSNITGTSPQSGVDIEPNVSTDELRGIRLDNISTYNCAGAGIKATINDLPAGYPLDIVVTGHRDTESAIGFNPQYGTDMTGHFIYRDALLVRPGGNGVGIRGWRSVSSRLTIENVTVEDPNEDNDTTNAYNGHAVSLFATGSDAADDVGNVDIIGLRARDSRGSPQMKSGVYARNTVLTGTSSNVRVIRPLEIGGTVEQAIELKLTTDIAIEDPYEVTRRDYTADSTYSASSQHVLVTNSGAAGTITISLDANCGIGDRVRFRVEAAQEFRVDPDGASSILPGGSAGVRISSRAIGSEIELLRISTTAWYVVRSIGVWTFSDGSEAAQTGWLEGSNSWDPTSIADGDVLSRSITVTGAALGDFALAAFSLDTSGLALSANVTASNTVTARLLNNTGAAVDLGSGTVYARVFKKII